MKTSVFYFFLFIAPFFLSAQTRQMTASEVNTFQQKLKKTAEVKSLSADFIQYKHMSFMKKPVESAGKVYVKQPNKLSWAYVSPFQYKMVFKDGKIFINDQGDKKTLDLGNSKQFEKISKLISSSMKGSGYDEKEFVVTYFKKGNADMVKLRPKMNDAKKYVKEIELLFSTKDEQVEEVKLIEPSNDYTRFVLKNRKINTTIDDAVFNL
ncbi:outer membrane lipoprotein carrier protein LolA [Sphingobacterium deserti]|uniref:Outer membrane lipoprotein carrier protein LolA n=1 Tax=Sphingobacterium deserti TaxID=1229276 RepID=A0A0B8T4K5_9SPHI|nr:outer membrane lipoprotein carrier protein LolA [Sphingobacterium deserti]KGE14838.1 outer membrane lipoprotein carrier protein LolA [Sphingobacterium deserti]